MSLPSINFLHLTVSEIQPGQTFSRRPTSHPDTMGENNTPTALKGCGVKIIETNLYLQIPKKWSFGKFPFSQTDYYLFPFKHGESFEHTKLSKGFKPRMDDVKIYCVPKNN